MVLDQENQMTVTVDRPQSAIDRELAQAVAAGDSDAFEKLYRKYYKRVYSLCLRMLGVPTLAEDMAQEVILLVYRKIGSFPGYYEVSNLLHTLSVSQVL